MKEKEKRRGRRRREEEEEKMEEPRSRPKRYGCLDFSMELWILYGSHRIVSFICLNACLQI